MARTKRSPAFLVLMLALLALLALGVYLIALGLSAPPFPASLSEASNFASKGSPAMQPYVEAFSRLPTLTTPRLILRPVRMSDAQDLYEYSRDPQVAQHVLWEAHRSIHQTRAYIRYLLRQYRNAAPGTFAIALRDGGKVIGTIGFMWVQHDNAPRRWATASAAPTGTAAT